MGTPSADIRTAEGVSVKNVFLMILIYNLSITDCIFYHSK